MQVITCSGLSARGSLVHLQGNLTSFMHLISIITHTCYGDYSLLCLYFFHHLKILKRPKKTLSSVLNAAWHWNLVGSLFFFTDFSRPLVFIFTLDLHLLK